MKFNFSRQGLKGNERALERFFEILPGLFSWALLSVMFILSFWKPLSAAVLIIAFDFYWLLRLFYLTFFLILSYLRLSIEKETDWMSLVHGLDRLEEYLKECRFIDIKSGLKKIISFWIHHKEIESLRKNNLNPVFSGEIYHLVIIPVANEELEIIEPGIAGLACGRFPPRQILTVIALEERASEKVKEGARAVQDKYRHCFFDFLVITHPEGLKAEARVKGANATYAAKEVTNYLGERKIPFEKVIVSCFDADTVVSPDYFGCLTYHFMISPHRTQTSFQPIPVYHNNIWEASGFARVLDVGSSFFQLIEATNPEKLVTFSSHSMSFKALVDVGYWPVDMISDDSAIFWKAFIHFDGNYRVVPIYVTLSMDTVCAGSWWKTIKNVYRQKRRWAWGVENFPIVMRSFLSRDNKISFYDRIRHGLKLFEGHISWSSWAFLLIVIGWFPAIFAGREFSNSVFYYSAPRISAIIFNLASLSLLTSVILSLCLLPPKKVKNPLLKKIGFALEWLLIPFIAAFLSALPALDAQTRLMLGRYMEFWVTEKKRG